MRRAVSLVEPVSVLLYVWYVVHQVYNITLSVAHVDPWINSGEKNSPSLLPAYISLEQYTQDTLKGNEIMFIWKPQNFVQSP